MTHLGSHQIRSSRGSRCQGTRQGHLLYSILFGCKKVPIVLQASVSRARKCPSNDPSRVDASTAGSNACLPPTRIHKHSEITLTNKRGLPHPFQKGGSLQKRVCTSPWLFVGRGHHSAQQLSAPPGKWHEVETITSAHHEPTHQTQTKFGMVIAHDQLQMLEDHQSVKSMLGHYQQQQASDDCNPHLPVRQNLTKGTCVGCL